MTEATGREDVIEAAEERNLQRSLSNRHIQLIALGGAIGTGLFLGSGETISKAGPSILFVYAVIGFMLYFVMRAMGELLLHKLEYRSFQDFAADILGPSSLWDGHTGSAGSSSEWPTSWPSPDTGSTGSGRTGGGSRWS